MNKTICREFRLRQISFGLPPCERARRVLRRGCEPIFARFARKDGFGVRVPKRPTVKPSVFVAPATGIEPITTP